MLADLSGHPIEPLKRLADRHFVEVNRDNFDDVLAAMKPSLSLRVENILAGDGSELNVRLQFGRMADFAPGRLALQVEPLRSLIITRANLGSREPPDSIDALLSRQVARVLHHPDFQKLEGSWRGLQYLVFNSEISPTLKVKVLNVSKPELAKDLETFVEFDQTRLWKKIYVEEFCVPGGEPFGVLIGDYEFSRHPGEVQMLRKLSEVAAASFCPFVAAASPSLFEFKDFADLPKPRILAKIFLTDDYKGWNAFRETEESRFVALVLPRVMARRPFGDANKALEEFTFEEFELNEKGRPLETPHEHFCWMNAAYAYGAVLARAFAKTGWCLAIRGYENGGRIDGLPLYEFVSADGDTRTKCPTEVVIDDRRNAELEDLGLLPLLWYKTTDYAVFSGSHATHKPIDYGPKRPNDNLAAQLSTRLPFVLLACRLIQYLSLIVRSGAPGLRENKSDLEAFLNKWISEYVCDDPQVTEEIKARFPLASAKVEVGEVPGAPGYCSVVLWIRPSLYPEVPSPGLRFVTKCRTGYHSLNN